MVKNVIPCTVRNGRKDEKAMSIWKRIFSLIVLLGCLCVGQVALAQSSTLELQAVVAEKHEVALACSLGGRATLEDGTELGSVLSVKHNEPTAIYIMPDNGYKVKNIIFDGENITSLYKDGKITLPFILKNGALDITFEKLHDTPQTGEDRDRWTIVWTMVAGLSLAVVTSAHRKNVHSILKKSSESI